MLYDYPEYYEIAFSFRNIEEEAGFIITCLEKFSDIPVKSIFEVACGHAPHAGELVKHGYRYVGLDINRNMLDYAAFKWRSLVPPAEFIEGDMVNFTYPKKVDFAFVMLGSLYLNSLEDMTRHFNAIARILNPGGLYFLDWCIQFNDPMVPRARNDIVMEKNGIMVESRFNTRLIDSARQMYEEVWTVNIDDHGRHKRFEMIERNRAIFPQEFLLFLESRTDFDFVGWWHDWDLNQPIEGHSDVKRPLVLIKRK
ncbi:MAG: class I SAM-dependent methyltransferase [candidate division Zixibacteria bacterium]|nr:class I SAM-dependent methyltransferase [candidate division Zixibacteria bacterium]MDD5425597.1 class I SAM-dependent methyltransferase [candidate division Zixibacteria bacterium]